MIGLGLRYCIDAWRRRVVQLRRVRRRARCWAWLKASEMLSRSGSSRLPASGFVGGVFRAAGPGVEPAAGAVRRVDTAAGSAVAAVALRGA